MTAEDPTHANQEELLDAEERKLVMTMLAALEHNIPEMGEAERVATAQEFLGSLGRLVQSLERMGPPTPAKAAAVLQFAADLGMDRAGYQEQKIIVTLTEAFKKARGQHKNTITA